MPEEIKITTPIPLENGRIDVIKYANDLGIDVYPINFLDSLGSMGTNINGYIQHVGNGKFAIYINPNQSKQRQRFTVAHELGHYEKHRDEIMTMGKVDRDSVNSLDRSKEEEADKYAAELLMPEQDMRTVINKNYGKTNPILRSAIEELSKRYDVSMQAIIIRLRELKYYVPYIDLYV